MFRRIYESLIGQFVKRTGRQPEGMDLLKLKLQAQEEVRQAEKILPFTPRPESPFGKPGGWMPSDEEVKGIMSNLKKGKTKPGKINYEEMQKQFPDVKLFGDESFDELLEIEKTGVHPRKNKSRLLTDDEIEDYEEILGDSETWMEKGTVEEAEAAVKRQKDYENYMFGQYKAGRLDPKTGEISKSRLNYLKNKLEEMEMSGDKKLITPDEIEELSDLEKRFEYLDLQQKAQNVDKKLSTEEINKLKELDDMGFADVLAEIDRNKKSKGGRIKLKKGGLSHILGV